MDADSLSKAREIAGLLAALPAMQSGLVKEYFTLNPLDGETSDHLANRLFMRATLTEPAQASLRKFGTKK